MSVPVLMDITDTSGAKAWIEKGLLGRSLASANTTNIYIWLSQCFDVNSQISYLVPCRPLRPSSASDKAVYATEVQGGIIVFLGLRLTPNDVAHLWMRLL